MNKNKFYVYALLCLSLISYPCIASESEKEGAAQALINLSNPSPQSEQQPYILPQHSGHEGGGEEEEEEANSFKSYKIKSLKCQFKTCECKNEFESSELLKKHIQEQHANVKRICTYCGKSFAQLDHLRMHKRTHTGEKPFPCGTCDKSFAQLGHLTMHKRTHTGEKPFPCGTCDKSFAQLSNLKVHTKTHTGDKSFKRTIKGCSKSFLTSSNLKRHQTSKNGCQSQLFRNFIAGKANASIVASSYQSDSSNKEDVHDSDETESEQPFTPRFNDLTQQMRTKSYECILCGESFAQLSDLKSHFTPMSNCWLQLKRTRAAFKDDFSIAKSLDQADASEPSKKIVAIETPESESEFTVASSGDTSAVNNEPYKIKDLFCKFKTCECKNEFESSELLKKHIQEKHSQFKNVCEICGKSFAQLGDLARHTRTHTGDKPFPCETCDKSFARKDALARHTRAHTDSRENRKRKEPHQDKAWPSHQAELSRESDESEEIYREEDTETEE